MQIRPILTVGMIVVLTIGCAPKEPSIPALVDPVAIVDGGFYEDGGSVAVTMKDSKGTQLSIVYSQDTFPDENYEPNQLYIGTIDEMGEGKATRCPTNSKVAVKLASYLEIALRQNDPKFVSADVSRGRTSELDEPREISAAKGLLQFLKAGIPANLERVN